MPSTPALPASLWAAVTPALPSLNPVDGDTQADVTVIGAGFTGLSTALHLRRAGVDVAVVEAAEPGWGASGRNNGQVIPTLSRPDPDDIITKHGAAGERLVASHPRLCVDTLRYCARRADRRRSRAEGMDSTRAFSGTHEDRRAPRAAMVEARRAGRASIARRCTSHDRLGHMVRWLLEPDWWSHQSSGAHARPGPQRARPRRSHLCAIARHHDPA